MISIKQFSIDNIDLPVMIINLKKRSIVSVPTQVGCAIGCRFCISSQAEFTRNLTKDEISKLVDFGLQYITNPSALISFTGEGEPFLNLKQLNGAMEAIHENPLIEGFRLCTSGVKPSLIGQVVKTSQPLHLQFSMHSSFDDQRKHLIPKTKPLKEILGAIKEHEANYHEIAVNYVLMKGFNDSQSDLTELSKVIPKDWIIKLNPLLDEDGGFKPSSRLSDFYSHLKINGHAVEQYNKVGSTIKNNFYSKLAHEKHNAISMG